MASVSSRAEDEDDDGDENVRDVKDFLGYRIVALD